MEEEQINQIVEILGENTRSIIEENTELLEDITIDEFTQLHNLINKHGHDSETVLDKFCEALKSKEYDADEILEKYGEDSRHLEFMAGDPDDIVRENSDNHELVRFAIKNYDIDVQQIKEDLQGDREDMTAAVMDFDVATGANEEGAEQEDSVAIIGSDDNQNEA